MESEDGHQREATQSIWMRRRGENSIIENLAATFSRVMTEAIQGAMYWQNFAATPAALDKYKLTLILDLRGMEANPELIAKVEELFRLGRINKEDYLAYLKRVELVSHETEDMPDDSIEQLEVKAHVMPPKEEDKDA